MAFPPTGGSRHTNCDWKSRVESVVTGWYLDVITAWETARYEDVSCDEHASYALETAFEKNKRFKNIFFMR